MLGTREKMEAHAQSAIRINTKQAWGLVFALTVHRILRLQLEASQTLLVNVILDTRGQMEVYARSVLSTNTKQAWGLVLA